MKTIIVPFDFSQESINGLNMAIMMAKKTRSDIQMVHVMDKLKSRMLLCLKRTSDSQIKFEEIVKNCKENNSVNAV